MKRRNVRFKSKTVPPVRFGVDKRTQIGLSKAFKLQSNTKEQISFVLNHSNFLNFQVRTLSLIIVTFTYLLVGAAIFDYLEGDNNEKAYKVAQSHFLFNIDANQMLSPKEKFTLCF